MQAAGRAAARPVRSSSSTCSSSDAPSLARRSMQRACGASAAMGSGLSASTAPVSVLIHLHDGNAGGRVTGLQRTPGGRGAAPARQQRGVDVQAAQGRQLQQLARQDQPIGHDDDDIRLPDGQLPQRCGQSIRITAQLDGCITGKACEAANSATGLAVSCRPRPAGRSGCVITPRTSCCATSADSGSPAKGGRARKHDTQFQAESGLEVAAIETRRYS